MKQSLLSVAAASALIAMSTASFAADIEHNDTQSEAKSLYQDDAIDQLEGNTFLAEGSWLNILYAQDGKTHTVSGFESFTVKNDNQYSKNGSVNGFKAENGSTLKLMNMGSISISESGVTVSGANDPIPIHAYGGHIVIEATGDISLDSQSNAIMSQGTTRAKEASVKIKTAGDFKAVSAGTTILAGLIQDQLISSKVDIEAKNINIVATKSTSDGIDIYDSDQTYNPNDPKAGYASVNLNAVDNLSITGGRYGVFQTRKGAITPVGSVSTFKAGKSINISASGSAVRAVAEADVPNDVIINAPNINLESDGTIVKNSDNTYSYYATVQSDAKGNIVFTSDTGKAHITIRAENGNAIGIGKGGVISGENANINVAKGNVHSEDQGKLKLTNSSLTLAKGSTAKLGQVEGSNSSIVLNDLEENTVTVASNTVKSLRVLASSAVTASEGVEAVAQKIRTAAVVQGTEADTAVYGGEGTGLTSDYLIDGNGAVSYANGAAESAILSSVKHFNAANLSQWCYEVNHLSDRLGDVRNQKGSVGSWARVYGADAKTDDSVSTEMRWNSIQVGADVKVGDNWIVGGAFGYTDGRGDFTNGDASSDGYTFAAYGTAFFPCGGYVDLIGRVGRISSDITLEGASTSYDNTTFGLSAEVGYKWDISQTFFVTPQAELSYGYVKGDDYTFGHALGDVRVEQDDYTTLVGRLGFQAGANFPNDAGQIYVTASVNHDFQGDTDSTAFQGVEKRHISEDIGGTWFSYGVGAQIRASDSMFFYGSLTRANGSDYQEDFRYSAGMRILF